MKKTTNKRTNIVSFTIKKVPDWKPKTQPFGFKKTFSVLVALTMVFYLISPGLSKAVPVGTITVTVNKVVVGGTATADQYTLKVNGTTVLNGVPTNMPLATALYYVTESGGPSGYTASFTGDCNSKGIISSLSHSSPYVCTITNTFPSTPPSGPKTTFHFIKEVCPAYSDIAGNSSANQLDDTGGQYVNFSNYNGGSFTPAPVTPVDPKEISGTCRGTAGWSFNVSDNEGMNNSTAVGPTSENGRADVPFSALPSDVQTSLTSGGQMWVTETVRDGFSFGALRCYKDAFNGDNSEQVSLGGDTNNWPADVYCIAYNVQTASQPQTGSLNVVKNTIGGDGTFGFSGLANDGAFTITTSNGTGSTTFDSLTPGPYSVTETALPLSDTGTWSRTSNTCDKVSVVAGQTATCIITNTYTPPPVCPDTNVPQTIVSDTTTLVNSNPAVATYVHPLWTSIPGATWIWDAGQVADPTSDQTDVFTKTFNISGTVNSAGIDIASDNGYLLKINGTPVDDKLVIENNYSSPTHYDVTSFLQSGANTLEITVKNFSVAGSTYDTNPAGLLYKLVVDKNDCPTPPPADGTLVVKKVVEGIKASPSRFSFSVNSGSAITFNENGENDLSVAPGTYTITEPAADGYTTTYDNCSQVQVSSNATTTCTITNTFNQTPPTPTAVSVHIFKFIDGVLATANNAGSTAFPMVTTFTSITYGNAVDAPFTLSPTGWGPDDSAYEASFANANPGADYSTNEVTGGSVVGATCDSGQPFALVGYTTGSTLAQAQDSTPSATIPTFTNLQGDEYIIVWNKTCSTTPPTTGTLTVFKNVVGGQATSSDFSLHVKTSGEGSHDVDGSPQPGDINGTSYTLAGASYTVSESGGPKNYLTSFGGACDATGNVTVVNDQSVTCTVTNTYIGTCTQPAAHELDSGTTTLTAGWTNVNPSSTPLNLSLYSGSGTLTHAVAANVVIPPWVNPASAAVWISTDANHPGEPGGEGLPGEDQWRLFEDSFSIPADASVSPVTLYFTADNAATVYLNGTQIASTTDLGTFDPAIPNPPQVFSNIYSVTFTPFVGTNTLDFVVRNEGGEYSDNPTGLLYRVVYQEQDNCGNGSGTNTTLNLTISNGTGDGEGTVSGNGLVCDSLVGDSVCNGIFPSGSNISLTAVPHAGSNFTGTWTSGPCASNSNPVCSFTLTSATTVNAHFSLNSTTDNGGGGGGSTFSGGGGTSGGGFSGPVTNVPPGQVLGATTNTPSGGLQYPGSVLGTSTTLPRTGMPPAFLFLVFATIAALVDKKLKLI